MASQPARTRTQNTRQEYYAKADKAVQTAGSGLSAPDLPRRSERLRQQYVRDRRPSRAAPRVLVRKRGADDDDEDDDEQRVKRARLTTDDPAQAPPAVGDTVPLIESPDREKRKRRRARIPVERDLNEAGRKRRRTSLGDPVANDAVLEEEKGDGEDDWRAIVRFWVREGRWPEEYFQACSDMAHVLARKRSSPSIGRKRSSSASSVTPSDQRPREEKSAPYRDSRYELLLKTKGVYMEESPNDTNDITHASKELCVAMLEKDQPIPQDSLFRDDRFKITCRKLQGKNESRVIQDVSRLLVPSAESFFTSGAEHLENVIESVNEGWNNSIPITKTRPQPDYSVGFSREAFSNDQLHKLAPFLGEWLGGDLSFFMATYYMHFPFLACEVKCGNAALDVADRQNAHSMTVAARAVVELFRLVGREAEVHRRVLSFSVSHDHQAVRIYGYYPVIEGKDTKYYRHPVRRFDFAELNGKEKWTAYRFTKNVYDIWMPSHFKMICSAIDQLPSDIDFGVDPLPESGLSQGMKSLSAATSSQSPLGSTEQPLVTPDSSLQGVGTAKRAKKDSVGRG